jgi:hypothetical protein
MLAVGFMRYGGPEVLEIYDLPEVHAGPDNYGSEITRLQ